MNSMKYYRFTIAGLFIFSLVAGIFSSPSLQVRAQSEEGWTTPVNLSNSGSTTSPTMVIDDKGTIHVFWFDEFDGYKYANSSDGVTWSEPKTVQTPFPVDKDTPIKPVMLAGLNGEIHILWKDNKGVLQYRQSSSTNLGTPSSWIAQYTLADSIVKFDAVVDSQGTLHIGYINNLESDKESPGVYYRRLSGSGWSPATVIYPSKYYRSLEVNDDANIQLSTTTIDDAVNVYLAWDDRSQRRIFLSKSEDGGTNWGESFQVRGPEDFSGVELPYNIDLSSSGDQVLLLWQAGIPGDQCVQYSQWSSDGAKQFSNPLKVQEEFAQCPQSGQLMHSDNNFSVVLFNTFNNLSLMAWNGSRWSTQLTQNEIASFINPVTLDSVLMGCQNASYFKDKIYVVGCDTGSGGDIWFTSRPLGLIDKWFPPPSIWGDPISITSADQKIKSLLSVADLDNHIHDLWIQNPPKGSGALIQYARWDGTKWTDPSTIISGSKLNPSQPILNLDSQGILLLAWVDSTSGDMYFTWANSDYASSASEWQTPIYIPSASTTNSSPDILTDSSDRMIIAYAVPINEERGIYIIESDDLGTTWSKPYRVFDASALNWHMVDRPHIAATGDGRLHILFERYALWGDERNSIGLYYIQSSDGGITWSQPEAVSEQPVQWSELISDGESNLHRLWQEQRDSTLVSLHQFSSDGGTTWSAPTTLTSLTDITVVNSISKDQSGNLYFLQLTGPDNPAVLDQRWDKSRWKTEEHKALDLGSDPWDPSSIVSGVSADGYLVVSTMIDSSEADAKWQSKIFSMVQFLEPSGMIPTPYPVLIPTAGPVQVGTQAALQISQTSVPSSPLAGVQDNVSFWSKNRNLIGLMLLGMVVVLLGSVVISRSKSNDNK